MIRQKSSMNASCHSVLKDTDNLQKPFIIRRLEKYTWKSIDLMTLDGVIYSNGNGYALDRREMITGLNLCNANLSDISFLSDLSFKYLSVLKLSCNNLEDIFPLLRLKSLRRLYLMDNQITQLPVEILQLGLPIKWECDSDDGGAYFMDNPLQSPPISVVKRGGNAVQDYFSGY